MEIDGVVLGLLGVALAEEGRVESARLMCGLNSTHAFALCVVEEVCHATLVVEIAVVVSVLSSGMLCLNKLTEGGIERAIWPILVGETLA